MQKIITFRKWVNPLDPSDSGEEYINEDDLSEEDLDNDLDETYVNNSIEEEPVKSHNHKSVPIIITPLGIMPLKPSNDPSKMFNFWLAETNFDITPSVVSILSKIPGIEILDVFTRYKLRIAIGNNFKFKDVKKMIQQALMITPDDNIKYNNTIKLDKSVETQIQDIIDNHFSKYPYWGIYILPNGEIDTIYSENKDMVDGKIELYRSTKEMVGGKLYSYDT